MNNDDQDQIKSDTSEGQLASEPVDQSEDTVETEAAPVVGETDQIKSHPEDGQPLAGEDHKETEAPAGESTEEDHEESAEEQAEELDSQAADASTDDTDSTDTQISSDLSEPDEGPGRWYVVHTYSGHENRVAAALKQRIESEHLEEKIMEILVPTQEKIEIRGGKKETVKEKIFPGYILVKMVLDDDSWLAVRTTQGVTAFIGMGSKPTPIPASEVKSIVNFMQQGGQPTYKQLFAENDTVKIVDGPFAEFIGKVESVDKERGKVKVLVSIFGRETPVELDFLQVAKL